MVTKVWRQLRFNRVYADSSKTEQASEITMTSALYCCTTQTWQHVLSACGLNDYKYQPSAIYIVQQHKTAGVQVISEACSVTQTLGYYMHWLQQQINPVR